MIRPVDRAMLVIVAAVICAFLLGVFLSASYASKTVVCAFLPVPEHPQLKTPICLNGVSPRQFDEKVGL